MRQNLPELWFIAINEESRPVVNPWKVKQEYNQDLFERLDINYVTEIGGGYGKPPVPPDSRYVHVEITLDEFERLVLGKEPEVPIIQNYDYLIPLLENIC